MSYDLNEQIDSVRIPIQPDHMFILDGRVHSCRIYIQWVEEEWINDHCVIDATQPCFALIGYGSIDGQYPIAGMYKFPLTFIEELFFFLRKHNFHQIPGKFGLLYTRA